MSPRERPPPVPNTTRPTVAFVIPMYQSEQTVASCLRSVLDQAFSDFEVVVVDDGSTDRSTDIVADFARRDHRIRLIRNQANRGVAKSLNTGLAATDADLVARLDADDEAEPLRLQRQVELMESAPEVVVCGSFVTYLGRSSAHDGLGQVPVTDGEIRQTLLETGHSPFFHPSVMFRRSVVVAAGGYREFFANAEDYDLWLRLASRGAFYNLPVPLTRYRLSPQGASIARLREQRRYAQLAKVAFDLPQRDLADLWDELTAELDGAALTQEVATEYRQQAQLLADLGHPLAAAALLVRVRHEVGHRAGLDFAVRRLTRALGRRVRALVSGRGW